MKKRKDRTRPKKQRNRDFEKFPATLGNAPIEVRSTRSVGNKPGVNRPTARYTRKANRKARLNGFIDARSFASWLVNLAQSIQRMGRKF